MAGSMHRVSRGRGLLLQAAREVAGETKFNAMRGMQAACLGKRKHTAGDEASSRSRLVDSLEFWRLGGQVNVAGSWPSAVLKDVASAGCGLPGVQSKGGRQTAWMAAHRASKHAGFVPTPAEQLSRP